MKQTVSNRVLTDLDQLSGQDLGPWPNAPKECGNNPFPLFFKPQQIDLLRGTMDPALLLRDISLA